MNVFSEHMSSGATTVCRAWIVRRTDGLILGFTDHDAALVVDGVTCRASSGLTAGALEMSTGLSVDNTEARGALSDDAIRADDIAGGLWDDAEIKAYLVNWDALEEFEILFRGTLGEITWGGGAFSAELRGMAEKLNKTRGRVYQKRCDAILGDGRCGKVLDGSFVAEAGIVDVVTSRSFIIENLSGYPPQWFDRGEIRLVNDGPNGFFGRIKSDTAAGVNREITLWQSFPSGWQIGDRVRLTAGCDKRHETCRSKFDNILNFRGFPTIPGEDWLMAYPTSGNRNDGGPL